MRIIVREVENKIEIPVIEWPGNCFGIAKRMLEKKIVKGKLRYGFWIGDVSRSKMFKGREIVHHGWIEKNNKEVVDPTRWVFEGKKPYIYEGKSDFYDLDGRLTFKEIKECPEYNKDEREFILDLSDEHIDDLIAISKGKILHNNISLGQAFWIANLLFTKFNKEFMKSLYSALDEAECRSLIPIDYWNYIMGGIY